MRLFKELVNHIENTADTQIIDKRNGELKEIAITIDENRLLSYNYRRENIYLYDEKFNELLEITNDSPFIYLLEDVVQTINNKNI